MESSVRIPASWWEAKGQEDRNVCHLSPPAPAPSLATTLTYCWPCSGGAGSHHFLPVQGMPSQESEKRIFTGPRLPDWTSVTQSTPAWRPLSRQALACLAPSSLSLPCPKASSLEGLALGWVLSISVELESQSERGWEHPLRVTRTPSENSASEWPSWGS